MTNGSSNNKKWKAGKNMLKSSTTRIDATASSPTSNASSSQSVKKCPSKINGRATSCRVRRRYFERLGINVQNANKTCYEKPLKDGCDEECSVTSHEITPPSSLDDSSSSQTEPKNSSHKRRRGVSFDNTVSVKPIPNRASYSETTRKEMYSSPEEIRRNFDRNTIEFYYENGDWRNVLEDDYFYTNKYTGEKIHPIHVLRIHQEQAQMQRHQSPFDTFVEMSQWL